MASYFQRILGETPAAETSVALQDVDQGLVAAKAQAEKRRKLEELRSKLANLKAQREQVAGSVAEAKKKRESITDDEIVRMAKIKGIKDEDVQAYINGRITQRNADISNNQTKAIKDQAEAEAASAKAKELEAAENMLLDLEQKITDNSIKLSTGNKMEKKSALATSRTLNNQYEKALAKYKALTGNEWESNVEETVTEEPAEEAGAPTEAKPEGFDEWTETEKAEYDSFGADEDKKGALVAKKKDAKAKEEKAEKERKERISKNTESGKASSSFLTAKNYAMAVAKDLKKGEGKTWTQLMTEWGWDVTKKEKVK